MIQRILLAAAVVLATHPAVACPPQGIACQVQHHGQRVVKRQVVQYAAPVVQHQQAYVAPQVNYGHAQQLVYPQQHYYTVGYELREQAAIEKVVREAQREIRAEVQEKIRGWAAEAMQEALSGLRGNQNGFADPGIHVAQQLCAKCHAQGSAKVAEGSPVLFNGLGEFIGTPEQAAESMEAIDTGRMPKGGPELGHQDFVKLNGYLEAFTRK